MLQLFSRAQCPFNRALCYYSSFVAHQSGTYHLHCFINIPKLLANKQLSGNLKSDGIDFQSNVHVRAEFFNHRRMDVLYNFVTVFDIKQFASAIVGSFILVGFLS